jgi:hypothetical protein
MCPVDVLTGVKKQCIRENLGRYAPSSGGKSLLHFSREVPAIDSDAYECHQYNETAEDENFFDHIWI